MSRKMLWVMLIAGYLSSRLIVNSTLDSLDFGFVLGTGFALFADWFFSKE